MRSLSLLLDTHALVWWMADDHKLSHRARELIAQTENMILVSSASLWEIAIKQRRGALTGCDEYLARYDSWHERWGFGTLAITPDHAVMAGSIEWAHKDPFDRMLVAQSRIEGATLVTCDDVIIKYHVNCVWS